MNNPKFDQWNRETVGLHIPTRNKSMFSTLLAIVKNETKPLGSTHDETHHLAPNDSIISWYCECYQMLAVVVGSHTISSHAMCAKKRSFLCGQFGNVTSAHLENDRCSGKRSVREIRPVMLRRNHDHSKSSTMNGQWARNTFNRMCSLSIFATVVTMTSAKEVSVPECVSWLIKDSPKAFGLQIFKWINMLDWIVVKLPGRSSIKMFSEKWLTWMLPKSLSNWCYHFPKCVARVPVSLWGSGGEAVLAKSCFMLSTIRNRPQPFTTVCVRAVRLSLCANASGVVSKVCQVDSWRHSYNGVCRGGVCVSDLWHRSCNGLRAAVALCRASNIAMTWLLVAPTTKKKRCIVHDLCTCAVSSISVIIL